jgi:hypothetical protein
MLNNFVDITFICAVYYNKNAKHGISTNETVCAANWNTYLPPCLNASEHATNEILCITLIKITSFYKIRDTSNS